MLLFAVLAACEPAPQLLAEGPVEDAFRVVGKLESGRLDEASGLQASENGVFFVHNDGGDDIYAIDATGRHLGQMDVKQAKNRNWEDITRVPGSDGPLLVIGDIGDKQRSRKKLRLYFVPEPTAEQFNSDIRAIHQVKLRGPCRGGAGHGTAGSDQGFSAAYTKRPADRSRPRPARIATDRHGHLAGR
jgi:hypothetical protein